MKTIKLRGRGGKLTLKHRRQVASFHVSSDRSLVASCDWMGDVYLWKLWDKTPLLHIEKAHADRAQSALISADQRRVISGGWDGAIRVWDVANQECVQEHRIESARIWTLKGSEDGACLLASAQDAKGFGFRLWPITKGKVNFAKPKRIDGQLGFVSDGRHLWDHRVTKKNNMLVLLDRDTLKVQRELQLPKGASLVTMGPRGQRFVVFVKDERSSLQVFSLADGACVHNVEFNPSWADPVALSLSEDAGLIAWLQGTGVRMCSTATHEQLLPESWGHTDTGSGVVLIEQSATIVSSGWDRSVRCWDLRNATV